VDGGSERGSTGARRRTCIRTAKLGGSTDMSNAHAAFWPRVDMSAGPYGCWPWTGGKKHDGYGILRIFGRHEGAHRASWILTNGPIDDASIFVCHRCDNPPCVNPAHLFLGTHLDNMRDMIRKGRRGCYEPKLTAEKAIAILEQTRAGRHDRDIAADFGISYGLVSLIRIGARWGHVTGVKWERQRAPGGHRLKPSP
jgi:hypothetical protein